MNSISCDDGIQRPAIRVGLKRLVVSGLINILASVAVVGLFPSAGWSQVWCNLTLGVSTDNDQKGPIFPSGPTAQDELLANGRNGSHAFAWGFCRPGEILLNAQSLAFNRDGGAIAYAYGDFFDVFQVDMPGLEGTAGSFPFDLDISGDVPLPTQSDAWWRASAWIKVFVYINGETVLERQKQCGSQGGCVGEELSRFQGTVNFIYGQPINITISAYTYAEALYFGPGGQPRSEGFANAGFARTVRWLGVSEVRDSQGNTVSGYRITSESGTDYSQPIVKEPVIAACPPDQSIIADASGLGTVPDFTGGVVATSSVGSNLTVTQRPESGTLKGVGGIDVLLVVSDEVGNASACTARLTVNDLNAPRITSCAPSANASADANGQAPLPDFTPGVSVYSPSGAHLTIAQSPSPATLVGLGSNSVTLTVTDDAGRSSTCTTTFMVDGAHPSTSQTVSFGPLPDRRYGDPAFAVSATSSSGLAVSFSAEGTCTNAGTMVTITGAGICTITASQGGDVTFSPAIPVSQAFQIARATPSITWNNPGSIPFGSPLSGTQLNAAASFNGATLSGAYSYVPDAGALLLAGTQSLAVQFAPGDALNFNSATGTVSITVLPLAITPAIKIDPATVQYSDRTSVTVTLPIVARLSPATSMSVSVGGQTYGPVAFSLNGSTISATAHVGPLLLAPASYPVTIAFTGVDANFSLATTSTTLNTTREDARATYAGTLFAATSSTSSSTATVVLSATIQDISAAVLSDADPGDVRNAKVSFVDRDSGAILCSSLPVGLVSAADLKTGTATCNWSANIGSADSAQYTIGVVVDGYYTRNDSNDDAIVTVSRPYPTSFITGGGYLVLANPAGLTAGDVNTRANFGFNVKYNKSGTNLQGRINTIIRRQGRVYQIKGNSMTSLSVQPVTGGGKATFTGKASITDITNPLAPVPVDGNATLQVTMTDNGEPGNTDRIGITVWNKSGGLWFSSNWTGTATAEQVLAGGNVVVR